MVFLRPVLFPALLLLSVVAGSSARNHDKQPTRRLRKSPADDDKRYDDAKRELNRALKEARLLQNDVYKRVQVDRGEKRFRSLFGKAKAKKRRALEESDDSSESEDASSDVTSSDTRRNRKLGEKDNALDYILQAY